MAELCDPAITKGCAFVVGVVGTDSVLSSYRLKGFYGTNKLTLGVPQAKKTTQNQQFEGYYMSYYWFVINDTVSLKSAAFDYQVSVSTTSNIYNPDLYITLMDGRWPTQDDFDMHSTMQGSDFVRISSDLTIWDEHGWDTQAGIVVVVGVKTITLDEPYILLLTNQKTAPTEITRINLDQSIEINQPTVDIALKERIY